MAGTRAALDSPRSADHFSPALDLELSPEPLQWAFFSPSFSAGFLQALFRRRVACKVAERLLSIFPLSLIPRSLVFCERRQLVKSPQLPSSPPSSGAGEVCAGGTRGTRCPRA